MPGPGVPKEWWNLPKLTHGKGTARFVEHGLGVDIKEDNKRENGMGKKIEEAILADYRAQLAKTTARLPEPNPSWYHNPDGIHGPSHTLRVLIHADALAGKLGLSARRREAVILASLWHDIGRVHDDVDRNHGARSAGKVLGLGLNEPYDAELIEVVFFAMEYHSIGDQYAEDAATYTKDFEWALETLWILKDADGLDRVRLGYVDPRQLRHGYTHDMIDSAMLLLGEMS